MDNLFRVAPEIGAMIDQDLDSHGRKKKRLRLEDREFFSNQTADLAALDLPQRTIDEATLTLKDGRPRMSSQVVFFIQGLSA